MDFCPPLSVLIFVSPESFLSYDGLLPLSFYSGFLLGNCISVVAIDLLFVSQAFSPLWWQSVAWGFVPELLWPLGLLNRNGTGTVVIYFPWPTHGFGGTVPW